MRVDSRAGLTMSVAALSTAGFSQFISASSNVAASQQALESLQQSLASGNLANAKTAFNTFQRLNQNLAETGNSSSSNSSATGASQTSKDLTALGTAINSGKLSSAQSAFATVQSDLKQTPSQAMANAETAVAQTVQWVDDLLSLSTTNNRPTTPVDPLSAILASAYGLNPAATSTNPTVSILDGAYGIGAGGTTSASASASASHGNMGNAASVNAFA
jgi:hypothetical protein